MKFGTEKFGIESLLKVISRDETSNEICLSSTFVTKKYVQKLSNIPTFPRSIYKETVTALIFGPRFVGAII